MDRLDHLLRRFTLSASMFHAGWMCNVNTAPQLPDSGYLHVIRRGTVKVTQGRARTQEIVGPSLLFYPRGSAHQLVIEDKGGAEMVCATVTFNGGPTNPICAALPTVVVIPISELDDLTATVELLFKEAFGESCGRKTAVDRMFEVVLIHILRQSMEQGATRSGVLAGLSDPRLARAIVAIHEKPSEPFSLDSLAVLAGMSRTNFAKTFKTIVGITPGGYLTSWRIALTQEMLKRGMSLKHICNEVGFGSTVALARAFKAQTGVTPRQWHLSATKPKG